MTHPDVPRQRLLKFGNFRPLDEVAVLQHHLHPGVDLRLVFAVLSFEINKFHLIRLLGPRTATAERRVTAVELIESQNLWLTTGSKVKPQAHLAEVTFWA
jgi:hypothetical protein